MNACPDRIEALSARAVGALDDEDDVAALDAHVKACQACAALARELEGALVELEPRRAPAGAWKKLEAALEAERARPVAIALACTFCKGRLERAEAVYCASCLAPHHADCFAMHGKCAACSEKQFVKARAAEPRRRSKAPIVAALVAASLAGFGSVAALKLTKAGRAQVVFDQPSLALARAEQFQADGKLEAARAQYEAALAALAPLETDSDLAIASHARDLVKTTRAAINHLQWETTLAAAAARIERKDFSSALRTLDDAIAAGPAVPEDLKARVDECRINAEGEQLYAKALSIIQARRSDMYGEALALLAKIDDRARVWKDARSVTGWVAADDIVRKARSSYEHGRIESALALLTESTKYDHLIGADAKRTIAERRTRWSLTASSYEAALRQAELGTSPIVLTRLFEEVMRQDPASESYYHVSSARFVELLPRPCTFDERLERAEHALDADVPDFAFARFVFDDLLQREELTRTTGVRGRIEAIVAKGERLHSWCRYAKAELDESYMTTGSAPVARVRDALLVLKSYLPADMPERDLAAKAWHDFSKRELDKRTERLIEREASGR